MKRLYECDDAAQHTTSLPRGVERRIVRLALLLRCRDEWLEWLAAMRDCHIVVPALDALTVSIWQRQGMHTCFPALLLIVDRILSFHWNERGLWCVKIDARWRHRSALGGWVDRGYEFATKFNPCCLVRCNKMTDVESLRSPLAQCMRLAIGRAPAVTLGHWVVSKGWLTTTATRPRISELATSLTAVGPWLRDWIWSFRAEGDQRCLLDLAAAWMPRDVLDYIWHLVLLLRHQARWHSLCEAARASRVVAHPAHPVEFLLTDDCAMEGLVALKLTRLIWDDMGPFGVAGQFCCVNLKTMHVDTSGEPLALYHVAGDAARDVAAHGARYWPSGQGPLIYIFSRDQATSLGKLVLGQHLVNHIANMRASLS
jgi:hypothetical protein